MRGVFLRPADLLKKSDESRHRMITHMSRYYNYINSHLNCKERYLSVSLSSRFVYQSKPNGINYIDSVTKAVCGIDGQGGELENVKGYKWTQLSSNTIHWPGQGEHVSLCVCLFWQETVVINTNQVERTCSRPTNASKTINSIVSLDYNEHSNGHVRITSGPRGERDIPPHSNHSFVVGLHCPFSLSLCFLCPLCPSPVWLHSIGSLALP